MTTYQAEFKDGSTKDNLSAEEAGRLFYDDDQCVAIRVYPTPEYKAP